VKVVINALQYKQNSSGIGILLRDLFGPYTCVARRQCQVVLPHDSPDFPASPAAEVIRIPWAHGQHLRRMLFQTFHLGRKYCQKAILLTTDSKVPFFLPKSCVLVPLVTDLAVYRLRETYQLSRVLWWRLQYWYVRRRADLFLAISEFTKQEMVEILHVPPEKIEVVPCACSSEMKPVKDGARLANIREKYDLPEHFVLFVGSFNPRKNLERLIRAFDRAKEKGIPHRLVIAGEQGWKFNRDAALRGIGYCRDICFIGYVPDEDMPALYSAADLFAFPTLYEGFGIPVLEAQACGTPALTSSGSAMPEVCGESAVFVDPYDADSIAEGILSILRDPKLAASLIEKGLENVQRFSWTASARRLDEIVESL
jgi:glycosyltransferase involved in cell wall biosynthesis